MSTTYVPARDADLLAMSANFSALITATPVAFGLVAGDATAYATLHTAYATALTAATNPITRSETTIATKVTARANLVFKLRSLANIIQATPTVTPTQKASLGLTIRDAAPTPIPAPATAPIVNVDSTQSLRHVCRYADTATPLSRARPNGVRALQVFVKVGTTPPASIADCVFKGQATRIPFNIDYDPADAGKTSYILANWINPRGETGPTSSLTTATVAA